MVTNTNVATATIWDYQGSILALAECNTEDKPKMSIRFSISYTMDLNKADSHQEQSTHAVGLKRQLVNATLLNTVWCPLTASQQQHIILLGLFSEFILYFLLLECKDHPKEYNK